MEYILSFDIAKGKSVYCFIDETKNIIIETTSINHNKKEFEDSRIYVDLFPCNECAKKLSKTKLKKTTKRIIEVPLSDEKISYIEEI